MTTWEAIFLGLIQGLTEFLPVSSSGHLELSQYLLGFQNLHHYILFNLVCHLGTLGAIVYMLFPQIKQSLTTHRILFFQVIVGTLPLFPLVLILKPIKSVFDQPQYLGICFLFSALLLFVGVYYRFREQADVKARWVDPLTIGLFQAVAILPGVSRSGTTISAARLLGWKKEESFTFSFLLAIPAILGGMTLELLQVFLTSSGESASIGFIPFIAGFLTSFLMGCLALRLLVRLLAQDKWIYFAWYCLFLGITITLYFNTFG
jgi:undecaprenyl-diphosphatase